MHHRRHAQLTSTRSRSARFERLEDRLPLAAASPATASSTLQEFFGSPADDLWEYTAGPTLRASSIKLNGQPLAISSGAAALRLDGAGGNDRLIFTGSQADETADLRPAIATFRANAYTITAVAIPEITARGGGGQDLASLFGSAGNDTFTSTPQTAELASAGGHFFRAEGFDAAYGYGQGGTDVAHLFDSAGNDRFVATATYGKLWARTYFVRVKDFDYVHAYGKSGGYDEAWLYDSPGNDLFVGRPTYARLSGSSFFNRAKYFDAVHAVAREGGYDMADLAFGAGQDQLEAADDSLRWTNSQARFAQDLYSFDYVVTAGTTAYDTRSDAADRNFILEYKGYWQVAPLAWVPGSWTLAVLPDTQGYVNSPSSPSLFEVQTNWLARHKLDRSIQFVVHEGDITGHNTASQWAVAGSAMQIIEQAGIGYALATGNHDYGPRGNAADRSTLMADPAYFPVSRLAAQPTFGGAFEPDRPDNSYHLFSAGGADYLVLSLEVAPRNEVVDWADTVISRYPTRRVILVTHAYLYHDNTRYDYAARQFTQNNSPHSLPLAAPNDGTANVNDGQQLWEKLVSPHANVFLVLNGHVLGDGAGRLASRGQQGQLVHQLLANYQRMPRGGYGYMRLLEFLPDGRTVQVKTFSPYLNRYLIDPQHQFTLSLA